ncbi:putative ATP-grasp-modified RiPP [Streptomyces sp. BI20]|uniref:putative ATP-grasp-modified RiPP n=1 Tax=Streptomyces sp. BI20 TaxID=3403460 RepID=UPI003C75AAF2
MTTASQPFGFTRLATYPTSAPLPTFRPALDPDTQTTVYTDAQGHPVEMDGDHAKPSTSSSSPTNTGADGGGQQPPAPADSDSVPDFD